MKSHLLPPLISLSLSLFSQSNLYGQAKEYTPQHPVSADAIPKADVITQVLPDRRAIFRLKARCSCTPLLGTNTASKQTYPVLFLYHDYGDTVYSWVTEGRVQQILDNAIADGRAVPMVVVIPETHALDPDKSPRISWPPMAWRLLRLDR